MSENKENIETKIDIQFLYNKGRKALVMDQDRNKNMINLLKHAEKLIQQIFNSSNITGQVYSKYHRSFKILREKVNIQLKANGETIEEMGISFKKVLNQIIDELSAKSRRYEEGQQRIKQLGKIKLQNKQQEVQQQQQKMKQQLLDIMKQLKLYATDMGTDLKRDSHVISAIGLKQDDVYNSLNRQNSKLKDINKTNSLGFFKLIGYSAIAVVVWIFTLIFIIIV